MEVEVKSGRLGRRGIVVYGNRGEMVGGNGRSKYKSCALGGGTRPHYGGHHDRSFFEFFSDRAEPSGTGIWSALPLKLLVGGTIDWP